ncbi:pyruvate flavodoxin/ferredoxin oxidoreductase [Desulfonema magnum]|uniref:2-oxoglutarate synthase subunit KorA n=1 Tax=Desulfonema magnum TaxID=45655 RepID=A0A975BTC2_9BACT|nr:pyruvate flavodoxin/ferredoxin oxidoreductase [Desulfonema magnum]QTA90879.1 2-oxoglutarate synthase subunit KorA [Desulfonema magnum]
MKLSLLEGNEAMAWGAYHAGCRFFAGYPISPATTIFNTMLRILPPCGGTVLQAEDEISALGCCIGASMGGLKAMTATSGPGLSLCSEQISFAIGSEIPLVIAEVQRLGPSTGSATRGADGDIQFMRWGNSGGMPLIVLAPVDIADCFTLTAEAFNLAEAYRCPVILASNKEIGLTRESIDLKTLRWPKRIDRSPPSGNDPFLPFKSLPGKNVPGFLPIGGNHIVRQTSSTHGAPGYITTDPNEIAAMLERMKQKIEADVDKFTFAEAVIEPKAETMILCYGVTARAAKAVCNTLKAEGKPVSLLILKTLWPVPENFIRQKTEQVTNILVPEMNLGQYVREIERILKHKHIEFLGQMDGRLITPDRIKEVLNDKFAQ